MTHRRPFLLCLATLLAWSQGCTQVQPAADFALAHDLIRQSTGVDAAHDPESPALTDDQLHAILAEGLTLDEAVRLALVNNRRLQAEFMRIGVARADWVQAGLLSNPSLEAAVLFPLDGGRSNLQASLAHNLVQGLRIPVKKRIAEHQVRQAVWSIAHHAAGLAQEVRSAYFRAAAAEELLRISRDNLRIVEQSHQAIQRQQQAGVAGSLDEMLGRGQLLSAELAGRNHRLQATEARRMLAMLLSLELDLDGVKLVDGLPTAAAEPFDPEALIRVAREHRLDLKAARAAIEAGDAALALERGKAFPDVWLGASAERLERRGGDGDTIDAQAGPILSLEIPLFDQNQAQVARARYLQIQALRQWEDLHLSIAQEIRAAVDRAQAARENHAFYRDRLLPQAEEAFRLARETFTAGRTPLLNLLESQRSLLEARRAHIEVRHQLAVALAELERTTGAPIAR